MLFDAKAGTGAVKTASPSYMQSSLLLPVRLRVCRLDAVLYSRLHLGGYVPGLSPELPSLSMFVSQYERNQVYCTIYDPVLIVAVPSLRDRMSEDFP